MLLIFLKCTNDSFLLSLMHCNSQRIAGCLKMQQTFFEHFNKQNVNIISLTFIISLYNNVSFVNAKPSAFFPCLWLNHDQLSSNSTVLKEFFNSNLLVLIYFSRLMIRIIMQLAKGSISINLIQSFLQFSSYLVSLAVLSESEVPPVLQFYSFI